MKSNNCRIAVILLFAASACSGPPTFEDPLPVVEGRVSGVAVKGLVADATVVVHGMGDGTWNEVLGEGATDASGSFDVSVGLERGHLLVTVTGGTYVEEATGETVGLGTRRLAAWVPAFDVGEKRANVQVNAVTTLIVAYTKWRMEALGEDFVLAERRAARLLNEHFGNADWRTTIPANPTTRRDLPFTESAVMGLLVSGLSWQAMEMGESVGVTGRFVNAAALIELLAEDLRADGVFNGRGHNERQLDLHDIDLDGQTLRLDLAMATLRFLQSDRNVSGLDRHDLAQVLASIVTNESELFDTPSVEPHFDAPDIFLDSPAPGSGVRGTFEIVVRATDPVMVTDIGFMAPQQIEARDPTGRHTEEARIIGTLDASPFDDGPLTLSVFAENDRGLRAVEHFTVYVSNHVPRVVIETPEGGETPPRVSGTVRVNAYAEPSTSTGARIVGMSTAEPEGLEDLTSVAARFEADWDTTTSPEGPLTLRILAEDEYGSVGEATVDVEVANREPVIVSGLAKVAGRPVRQAQVRAIALDRPDAGHDLGFDVIGRAATDDDGAFVVEIEDRNYDGPVSVVVRGGAWVDPFSDATIVLTGSRQLSTYLPSPAHLHEAGEQTTELVIGTWSTLADRLARHYAARPVTPLPPAAAWQRAEEMIGGHFHRNDPPALLATPTVDLTVAAGLGFQHQAWLSFADFGLVQLVSAHGDLSIFDLLVALSADVSTGRFDGSDSAGSLGSVGSVAIDIDTTRITLAMAIYEFAGSPSNGSGIDQELLIQPSGAREGRSYLDDLSTDGREIYGAPGTFFDTTGPMITWRFPADEDAVFGGEPVTVEAVANATYGVSSFVFIEPFVDGEPLLDELAGVPNEVRHRVSPTVPPNAPDYFVRIGVRATDSVENETIAYRSFTRTPPTAALDVIRAMPGGEIVDGPVRGRIRIEASGTFGFATESFGLVTPDPSSPAVGEDLDSSPDRIRIEVDTAAVDGEDMRLIPDGSLEVRVRHTTIEGRLAEASDFVVVDNTPPLLSASATTPADDAGVHWFGCAAPDADCETAPVAFTYSVEDVTSGVSTLTLLGSGGPVGGAIGPIDEVVLDLGGGCTETVCTGTIAAELAAGTYALRLRAEDVAGNVIESESVTVSVDTRVPVLADRSGTFDDEDRMDFRRDGGAFVYVPRDDHVPFEVADARGGVAAWRKMEHRLSAPSVEHAAASNVPVVRLEVTDPGAPNTPSDDLSVTYRYAWSTDGAASWNEDADWRALTAGGAGTGATHALPLSLERLGAGLLEGARHRVRIRAVDRAGNRTEVAYLFDLELLPAPVVVEIDADYPSAGDPESLYAYGFEAGNMGELFGGRTFAQDRVRLARFVIHQPHAGVVVPVHLGATNDQIEMRRRQRRYVEVGTTQTHECARYRELPWGGYSQCRDEAADPDPENDDPPCVDAWAHPDREHLYKVYDGGSGTCHDDRSRPIVGDGELLLEPEITPLSVLVLTSAGAVVPPAGDGSFHLAEGTYEGFFTLPAFGPIGQFGSTIVAGGQTVHGVVEEARRVYVEDRIFTLEYVPCVGCDCVAADTCIGHRTQGEDLVLYEERAEFRPDGTEDGSSITELGLTTGSILSAISSTRDPDSSADRTVSVHHLTVEPSL